jgi:hypothetical protein
LAYRQTAVSAAAARRRGRWLLLLAGTLGLSACALLPAGRGRTRLATRLQDLMPLADRNHFVYVFVRIEGGQRIGDGIQVEHVSALVQPNEFEVLLSENGVAVERIHVRETGTAILLLAEDDLVRGVRMTYQPPLPYVEVPLYSGERQAATTAEVTRLVDGRPLGSLQVTQVEQARPGPPLRSRLGAFPHTIVLRMIRTLQDPGGTVRLSTTMVLVPGIGEVRSEGMLAGAPSLQRELACALLGTRRVGDCGNLKPRWEDLSHAGSADVR